jgi:POT family proton-dependent oligopeptide transporter
MRPQRTFLGHPVGLYVLFLTEMWERFNYYGMRALLVPYMINYFRWQQQQASTTYKIYTSLVYVTPIFGGYLADRFLGNRLAVIIGATLMAVGQFCMSFETTGIFYTALVLLIIGNGFFKPNMSTQVGRLYPTNDGRRDGAYTIFYMGINLGAFLAPIACGWLQENTVGGYRSGFIMAGIGMVAGLVIYLLGQPLIREIDPNQVAAPATPAVPPAPQQGGHGITSAPSGHPAPGGITTTAPATAATATEQAQPLTEVQAEKMPSYVGALGQLVPGFLALLGVALLGCAPVLYYLEKLGWFDATTVGIGGLCLLLMAYVAAQVQGGLRDRVLAILLVGIFVIFFWAAFEQAGNVLNLWADKHTERYLTRAARPASLVPPPPTAEATTRLEGGFWERLRNMFRLKPRPQEAGDWLGRSLNPVPTAWFQSINAVAIVILAPFFAWMWLALDRRGWQPSIPFKMFLGLLLMSASMAVMVAAAQRENFPASAPLVGGKLPEPFTVAEGSKVAMRHDGTTTPVHAGRLTLDPSTRTLHILGVLPDNEAYELVQETAPEAYRKQVKELVEQSRRIDGKSVESVQVHLDSLPPGFDWEYAGLHPSVVEYRPSDHTLVAKQQLADKEKQALLVAGGDRDFRESLGKLYAASRANVVSPWWLVWSYILATFGELCLSPVGLSMVSKLAPARFATMLMGVWLLTSAFGNFAAGTLGEIWGTIPPVDFFLWTAAVVAAVALVLLVLVRGITGLMHGVK